MDDTVIILITLISCAFFSGMEIAFISANKLRLELKNKQGSFTAKLLSPFVQNPSKFISTILVGNNIALVIYSLVMEESVLHPFFTRFIPITFQNDFLLLFIETLVSTLFFLITAEFLPKVLFRINPDAILQFLAYPFLFFYGLFYPVVLATTYLSKKFLIGVFKLEWNESKPVFSKVDLDQYITDSINLDLEEDADVDTEIFKNALEFGNVKLRECMIPRTEITALPKNSTLAEVKKLFIESGHSKILIYEDTIDHVTGYVHQASLFRNPRSVREITIPIIIATEATPARDLLNQFTQQRKSIAVVVDEYGGTAGLVTLEDILEEIFGEIEDEFDQERLLEIQHSENQYTFSARLEVDYLNDKYHLDIPKGEYETLGGFLFNVFQAIPSDKDRINHGMFDYIIKGMNGNRIESVEVKKSNIASH